MQSLPKLDAYGYCDVDISEVLQIDFQDDFVVEIFLEFIYIHGNKGLTIHEIMDLLGDQVIKERVKKWKLINGDREKNECTSAKSNKVRVLRDSMREHSIFSSLNQRMAARFGIPIMIYKEPVICSRTQNRLRVKTRYYLSDVFAVKLGLPTVPGGDLNKAHVEMHAASARGLKESRGNYPNYYQRYPFRVSKRKPGLVRQTKFTRMCQMQAKAECKSADS